MKFPYADIVDLPRHVSPTRTPMSARDRAAQFAPFSALTGYDEVIDETARVTESRPKLSDDEAAALNYQLRKILAEIERRPLAKLEYFTPDETKSGGMCRTLTARVVKIAPEKRILTLENGVEIAFPDLVSLECADCDTTEES